MCTLSAPLFSLDGVCVLGFLFFWGSGTLVVPFSITPVILVLLNLYVLPISLIQYPHSTLRSFQIFKIFKILKLFRELPTSPRALFLSWYFFLLGNYRLGKDRATYYLPYQIGRFLVAFSISAGFNLCLLMFYCA